MWGGLGAFLFIFLYPGVLQMYRKGQRTISEDVARHDPVLTELNLRCLNVKETIRRLTTLHVPPAPKPLASSPLLIFHVLHTQHVHIHQLSKG